MPRRSNKGSAIPLKRRVKLEESLKAVNNNIDSVNNRNHNNELGGTHSSNQSSSEEETKKELVNGDANHFNSVNNGVKNGPTNDSNDKYLHKKFKKMATIAPFNYVNNTPPAVASKPPPLQLKTPSSCQPSPFSGSLNSPSPEVIHRINKLISDNQAIVETSDPLWPKKYMRSNSNKESISPSSPNRSVRDMQSPISLSNRTNNRSPSQFSFKVNNAPSSPLLISSSSYEAAYIKSLMSGPSAMTKHNFDNSPSSPLSSSSSSSSTEFLWPKTKLSSHSSLVENSYDRSKQTPESKLAIALLRPNSNEISSNKHTSVNDDSYSQPLNLTVKQNSHNDDTKSPPPQQTTVYRSTNRKRIYQDCFPPVQEEALNCKLSKEYSPKSARYPENNTQIQDDYRTKSKVMKPKPTFLNQINTMNHTNPLDLKMSLHQKKQLTSSPVKVSPPLPSPGPLLGKTPLVNSYKVDSNNRSHRNIDFKQYETMSQVTNMNPTTLRSLEELSRCPLRSNSLQLFGGEVQIRDNINDSKPVKLELLKVKNTDRSNRGPPNINIHEINSTKVVTMAKSSGLHSGGTTILQVPHPSENAQVPRMNTHPSMGPSNMLLIPVMSPHVPKSPHYSSGSLSTIAPVKSPHLFFANSAATPLKSPSVYTASSTTVPNQSSHIYSSNSMNASTTMSPAYNGGVFTYLLAGKAIPHVPGIPGPLSLDASTSVKQYTIKSDQQNRSSLEVKPIVKNGRVPSLKHSLPGPSLSSPKIEVKVDHESKMMEQSSPISISTEITVASPTTVKTTSPKEHDDKSTIRFLRPTSLPLKPGTYTPKRHAPASNTMSLVSPETPRPRKGYGQLYLNGHAYTYLGLKCSTKLFFCTLNKSQPIYVPLSPEHNKISMYSNWKICPEVEPNPFGLAPHQMMAYYCSSPRSGTYTIAQSKTDLLVTHSSYWYKKTTKSQETNGEEVDPKREQSKSPELSDGEDYTKTLSTIKYEAKSPTAETNSISPSIPVGALVPEVVINEEEEEKGSGEGKPKRRKIFAGGFESNEDYIYIRGRGRGRFVCEECGIRCRKPSMLKKHIKTHSDIRSYACSFCNFSFKTKGNLTKHMKSKAHFKKCVELGVSPEPTLEELSGDEKQDQRNSQSSESQDGAEYNGECDDEDDEEGEDFDEMEDEEDFDEDDEEEDENEDDENNGKCGEEEDKGDITDEDRINSELEHDVAHSLLSLSQMAPQIEKAGLSVSSVRPSTYPYSTHTNSSTSNIITTVMTNHALSSQVITVPSSSAVSSLPAVGESGKVAQSILPPTSPNSSKKKAEFLPPSNGPTPNYVSMLKDGRGMLCGICNKTFTKSSQLRLHLNIHYFERPFRCESCAVSFRTKGHLQKHQRSVSHLNKVNMNSTFGTATTTNPRPFKCDDCKIAFRIHGHLAKHLRSKMHIMKLECVGKLPFGTYTELERCGYNMNDIDTTDCESSLESLQIIAQKLYEKDPTKLGQWGPEMMPSQINGMSMSGSGESSDEGEAIEQHEHKTDSPPPSSLTHPSLHQDISKSTPVEIK